MLNLIGYCRLKKIKMNKEEVDTFEKVQAQIDGLHTEISALSKKSQNDALNKFKLKFVNQILVEDNVLLYYIAFLLLEITQLINLLLLKLLF